MKEKGEVVERELMGLEEFKKYVGNNLITFEAISKFKSIKRAIRRNHVMENGIMIPKRPFNNRANNSNRKGVHSKFNNELKKVIYGQYRQYQRSIA